MGQRQWIDNKYSKYLYPKKWEKELKPESSNVNHIVEWAEKSRIVEYYVCSYSKRSLNDPQAHNQDKVQEIYLMMLETPQSKWDDIYEQGFSVLKAYVIGLIRNQIYSNKSALYIKYNKHNEMELISDELFWDGYYEEN